MSVTIAWERLSGSDLAEALRTLLNVRLACEVKAPAPRTIHLATPAPPTQRLSASHSTPLETSTDFNATARSSASGAPLPTTPPSTTPSYAPLQRSEAARGPEEGVVTPLLRCRIGQLWFGHTPPLLELLDITAATAAHHSHNGAASAGASGGVPSVATGRLSSATLHHLQAAATSAVSTQFVLQPPRQRVGGDCAPQSGTIVGKQQRTPAAAPAPADAVRGAWKALCTVTLPGADQSIPTLIVLRPGPCFNPRLHEPPLLPAAAATALAPTSQSHAPTIRMPNHHIGSPIPLTKPSHLRRDFSFFCARPGPPPLSFPIRPFSCFSLLTPLRPSVF
jgi:hypothetical protein